MATQPIVLRATGRVAVRQAVSRASAYLFLGASLVGVFVLLLLAYETISTGGGRLSWDFISSYPSRFAERAGLRSSAIGSVWVLGLTVIMALPVAVGTAVWIEEFAPRNKFLTVVKLNLANLAGVPSIIYGVLGLAVFSRFFGFGSTIMAGAFTVSLMILPMTVIASQEAIRQVPSSIRDGALALGATQWQTVWYHVLPGAAPGIITGIILAVSRAAGETAALIMIGAFTFIAFDNTSPNEDFTTIPIQIYNWTIRPQEAFRENAAAAIIVLMVAVLSLNLLAAVIREEISQELARMEEEQGAAMVQLRTPQKTDEDHLQDTKPELEPSVIAGSQESTPNTITDPPEESVFSINELSLWYGHKQALGDVTFKIPVNRVTALIGPSGCGKSTLIRCLNRMNDLIPGVGPSASSPITARTSTPPISIRWRCAGASAWCSKSRTRSLRRSTRTWHSERRSTGTREHGSTGGTVAETGRPLERGEGRAEEVRSGPLRRSTAAPLHRPRARGPARCHLDGRAVLRTRPDRYAEDRGPYP